MYEPLPLRDRLFFIWWYLRWGGGGVGAWKIYCFKRGKEIILGLKEGSLNNSFKFYQLTIESHQPPAPHPPLKNERAVSLPLFQEYDEEKYSPRYIVEQHCCSHHTTLLFDVFVKDSTYLWIDGLMEVSKSCTWSCFHWQVFPRHAGNSSEHSFSKLTELKKVFKYSLSSLQHIPQSEIASVSTVLKSSGWIQWSVSFSCWKLFSCFFIFLSNSVFICLVVKSSDFHTNSCKFWKLF